MAIFEMVKQKQTGRQDKNGENGDRHKLRELLRQFRAVAKKVYHWDQREKIQWRFLLGVALVVGAAVAVIELARAVVWCLSQIF